MTAARASPTPSASASASPTAATTSASAASPSPSSLHPGRPRGRPDRRAGLPNFTPRFCPLCATALVSRETGGALRLACPACDFVHYEDPKVAVGVLVQDAHGHLLYTRRNHQPAMGAWALPSGFVDRGEEIRAAAVREVSEETGIEVALQGLLGVFSRPGDPVIFIVLRGRVAGGTLQAGPEASEVRFFPADALPPPAFPHDATILRAWRDGRDCVG